MHHVVKGWGYELWITNNEKYCGKILHFHDGKKCSWHKHELKEEHFWIKEGFIEITFGETDDISEAKKVILSPGDAFHVPIGLRHQMKAVFGPATMIEFSTQHFDSDSIRITQGDV